MGKIDKHQIFFLVFGKVSDFCPNFFIKFEIHHVLFQKVSHVLFEKIHHIIFQKALATHDVPQPLYLYKKLCSLCTLPSSQCIIFNFWIELSFKLLNLRRIILLWAKLLLWCAILSQNTIYDTCLGLSLGSSKVFLSTLPRQPSFSDADFEWSHVKFNIFVEHKK